MNYLAHLFLAGSEPELVLGNFIADHIKGSDVLKYSETTRKGIVMHRAIDAFTDQHPVVKQSIERLRPDFRKYSGVIVDMYYDHFLSAHWNEFSHINLEDFTRSRYQILNTFQLILPERSARLLYYMERQNWLQSYGSLDGMQQAFNGMSRRTTFESRMEHAVDNLKADYHEFSLEFQQFFPELQAYAAANFETTI